MEVRLPDSIPVRLLKLRSHTDLDIISGFTDRSSEKSTSYQTCIVIGKEGVYLNGIFRYT
jgi:hypothetical protein